MALCALLHEKDYENNYELLGSYRNNEKESVTNHLTYNRVLQCMPILDATNHNTEV